jgi:hypothetical protein
MRQQPHNNLLLIIENIYKRYIQDAKRRRERDKYLQTLMK